MTQTLLVIGACGAQGQSVIEHALTLGSNIKIIALTHRPDCEQAKQLLENPSVELKSFTPLQNQLVSIFNGVDIVYASANDHDPDYHLDNEEFELLFGKEIINSAINANVKHIIWSSLCDSNSPIASFSVKRQLERMLTNNSSKLKWTILYSAFFMENFLKFTPIQITNEAVTLIAPFTPETELHLFDVKDFGIVVKSILSQLDSFSNKKLCLFSERKTVREILQSFSRATQLNKSILLNEQDKNNDYSRELSDVLQWFKSGGYSNLLHSSSTFSSSDLTSLDSWISKNLQHFTSMQSKI